jgi:uncharacterized protein (DUF934 family)
MPEIWKETGFVSDDPWVVETEETRAGSNERAVYGLEEFIERASSGQAGLGVLVRPDEDVGRLKPFLGQISLVALIFPAFNDGRAFSHASLLRTRLGYTAELRAVGDVLIDQVPLMLRCGIDSFAVSNETALKRLAEMRLPGIDRHYQPTARPSADAKSYSWRRVS